MASLRQYELIYITPPDTTVEVLADVQQQVFTVVERFKGNIEKTEDWGRRKLAYEIGRHREGTYVLHVINGPTEMVAEIDRRLRVLDAVIRHMLVRVDEELAAAERAQKRRKENTVARRLRRGLPPEPTDAERSRRMEEDDDDAGGMEMGFRDNDRGFREREGGER
jgi:small subunit ribosomal protein S6